MQQNKLTDNMVVDESHMNFSLPSKLDSKESQTFQT